MKTIIFISALILITRFSFAAIVLDATCSTTKTNTSVVNIEHTISSGNILIVNITSKDQAISSVDWNGEPLILGTEVNQNSMRVAMYYLKSPATGTYNVNISTAGVTDVSVVVTSYTGVDLTNSFGNFSTLGNQSISASINVESAPNEVVIDIIGCKDQVPEADASQLVNGIVGTTVKTGSSRKEVGGNTTMTWNMDVINDWGAIGVSLKPDGALPVNLINFKAVPGKSSIVISWMTVSEINNDFFTLQKSTDGINFKDISKIKGSGTSNVLTNYNYTDQNPLSGTSYYRLKQTDFDLHQMQSEIVSVSYNHYDNANFNIYPNPMLKGQIMRIDLNGADSEKEVLIVVKNELGKELYSKVTFPDENGNILEAFDKMDRLPSGIYIIIASSDNKVYSKKLIIR